MGLTPIAIAIAFLLSTAGCQQLLGLDTPVLEGTSDAAPGDSSTTSDTAMDTLSADANNNCFGIGLVTVCFTSQPTGTLVLNAPINTVTDSRCSPVLASACVIAASQLSIEGTVVATGALPLVLVATADINVNGTLDVSSRRLNPGEQVGAGEASGAAACGSPTAGAIENAGSNSGGGGGAGGSFRGRGGDGAAGRNGGGGAAGVASSAIVGPTQFRGGCPGTAGGSGNGNVAGAGAHGGGAVYLIAGTEIAIAGSINASGEGGFGGQQYSGGGGGGSGGFIGLDAPSVVVSGVVFANGGGGGEGGGGINQGSPGSSGLDATLRAPGGALNGNGGDGGRGSQGLILDGEGGLTAAYGGGGGGGAAGFVRLYPLQVLGGTVSPPPT